MIQSILFAALIALSYADPQIHYLNSVLSLTDVSYLNVEIGSKLFVASNDSPDYLKMITAKIGSTPYTLDTLASIKNADGTQGSITITDKLTISTSNSDSTTQRLSGFIYITTADQAKDPNFSVYVSTDNLTVKKTSTIDVEATTVILNTKLLKDEFWYTPDKSAYVSNINQPQTSTLHILRGFPSANTTYDDQQKLIFMNPIPMTENFDNGTSIKKQAFFDHVEPLQLSLDSWFIKTKGSYSLTIENKWSDLTNYHTNSPTTTGLIMTNSVFKSTNVRFEFTYPNGVSGTFISLYPRDGGEISVIYFGSQSSLQMNYTKPITQALISTDMSAARLTVTTSPYPGEFYIQYFGIDGPPVSSTLPPSTISSPSTIDGSMTTTIESTTKSAKLFLNIFMIISMIMFEIYVK